MGEGEMGCWRGRKFLILIIVHLWVLEYNLDFPKLYALFLPVGKKINNFKSKCNEIVRAEFKKKKKAKKHEPNNYRVSDWEQPLLQTEVVWFSPPLRDLPSSNTTSAHSITTQQFGSSSQGSQGSLPGCPSPSYALTPPHLAEPRISPMPTLSSQL